MASIKRHLVLGSLLVGALAVPMLASADDMSAAASPAAAPTPEAWYQSIQVGGYADAYFQQSFNSPSDVINSNNDYIPYRAYNNTANQFSFGGAELTLKDNDAASGTGVFLDLMMGGSLNYGYGNQTAYGNTDNESSYGEDDAIGIGQAYITQAFGNLNFTLGKFATPIGYESTYLPSDANFSRSLLYQMEPTFSTGLEASYTLPMGFTVSGWVDNGPSADDAYSNGRGYGAQVGYAGIKNLNLTGTYYYDNTEEDGDVIEHSDLDDFVAAYSATDSLSFAGEFLNETQPQVADYTDYLQTSGYALYATYSPIANLSISPRYTRIFNNNSWDHHQRANGIYETFAPGNWMPLAMDDYTLTVKYQMGPLTHILEYEANAANEYEFYTGTNQTATQIQQTLTYAAVYAF